jgi:Flp pilus assembly pilin Flp
MLYRFIREESGLEMVEWAVVALLLTVAVAAFSALRMMTTDIFVDQATQTLATSPPP